MNNNKSNSTYVSGVSTSGLLGILFVALKLLGKIDWSWWLVTIPFWGVPAALFSVAAVFFLVYLLLCVYDWCRK